MNEKEYIETLENTIIFLCKTYEDCVREFMYKPDTCLRFPVIQGTANMLAISRISDFTYDSSPKYGFRDILDKLTEKVSPQAPDSTASPSDSGGRQ